MPRLFIPTLDTIGTVASGDLFIVSDVSATETKKVTFSSLQSAILGTLLTRVSTLESQVSSLETRVTALENP